MLKNLRIYFSSAYPSKLLVETFAQSFMQNLNSKFDESKSSTRCRASSSWHSRPAASTLEEMTRQDLSDLQESDMVIALHPPGKSGTNTEIGFALGRNLPLYYLVDDSCRDQLPFGAHASDCRVVKSVEELTTAIHKSWR